MYKKYVFRFIIVLIFLGPIGQFFLFKYTPLYDINLKTNLYDNASWVKEKTRVAIMGSSHAKYHIIPREILKLNKKYKKFNIINIAQDAAGPFEMYTTYKKNEEKLSSLEYLFYTLEPHMLGEKYYLYNDYEKIKLSKKQWDYLEKFDNQQNSFWYPFQTFVQSLQISKTKGNNEYGYIPLKHKDFNTFSKGKVKKQLFGDLKLFPISKFQISYLKKLKNKVEKNGTKFIFVLTPTYTWHKIYKKEAKEYDNQLITLLNKEIGDSVIIGSFYPEDYMLNYEDFKDDTHLSHSGALKFTKKIFKNLSDLNNKEAKKFKNTFNYKLTKNINNFDFFTIPWKYDKTSLIIKKKDFISFNSSKVNNSVVFNSSFNLISNINGIKLKISPSKEKLKMISITLRNGKEYAHFFIKNKLDRNRDIYLDKSNISKKSKKFNLKKIDSIGIRLYPSNSDNITDFKVHSIDTY